MQCPNCDSKHTTRLRLEIPIPEVHIEYGCTDCRATFSITGYLPIEWKAPVILTKPAPTIPDILRRLENGPIPRQDIPDVLYQAMLDKGLIVGERNITLKSPTIGRQSGRARRGDLNKVY